MKRERILVETPSVHAGAVLKRLAIEVSTNECNSSDVIDVHVTIHYKKSDDILPLDLAERMAEAARSFLQANDTSLASPRNCEQCEIREYCSSGDKAPYHQDYQQREPSCGLRSNGYPEPIQ